MQTILATQRYRGKEINHIRNTVFSKYKIHKKGFLSSKTLLSKSWMDQE